MNKKVILIILDGWGIATDKKVSAIDSAKTPFIDSLYTKYPHSTLEASGLAVGLPEGQMGNSEVGHMNIGAGRVVYQDLVKINNAAADGSLAKEAELVAAFDYAKKNNKKIHFIGLVSNGGVHSHINHLKGLISAAKANDCDQVFVHAFTDGRDCDPKSGLGFIEDLENHMSDNVGQVASVTGRYYAMDRDKRWERVKLAYDAMVNGTGEQLEEVKAGIQKSYEDGVTDEFIKPLIKTSGGAPVAKIEEGDVVMCFNFRTDRGREITEVLTQQDFPDFGMKTMPLYYLTMTNYDDTFKGVKVVFDKDNLQMTLGEVLANNSKKQIRIAETEKYPHVTFFFSGGRETEFEGEKRLLCPSPKVATYDLQPEMSANDIKEKIVPELQANWPDFVCLNFANPDMVGHTGVFEAAVKACETVDTCAKEVVDAALENGYTSIIIADHGNSDIMVNPDGSPNTAHTTNLVPFIVVDNEFNGELKPGKLGDLAPTILKLMGVEKPAEMTGEELL
ncbi:2,3-bisphosphoglycerate-independent phosphoglycerate mutase [Marinoscillum sp. MHG1-6]|uniref:2,3-bisphosphoglycerate-independent phosphoglycerate mutase n=1 Tax=Marinoscillum sp. MHG1-6 TaxID=2959627 RepID=UPI002156F8B2|nr:2,3-bisphosphoglycerate-independent phosphoglycerate mutase [Marinoscillum sp. MHG1-6]